LHAESRAYDLGTEEHDLNIATSSDQELEKTDPTSRKIAGFVSCHGDAEPSEKLWSYGAPEQRASRVAVLFPGSRKEFAMQLREVMTPNAEVVPPDATIGDAAKKMKALDIGALPVCDGDHLCGMITDRDIAIRGVAEGRDSHSPVRDAMTEEVIYCFEDQEYEEAAALMREHQVRRLPVLNRDNCLVGVVSLADVSLRGNDDSVTTDTVEDVSAPSGSTERDGEPGTE
jgi:CBS domain-containing protein